MLKIIIAVLFVLCYLSSNDVLADSVRMTPVVKVVQENKDAVVNISTERIVLLRENPFWGTYGSEFDIFFDQFFGSYYPTRALKLKSVGSGVILDKEGTIVTNAHVVNKASNIFVVLNDGSTLEGQIVLEHPASDLAIIKIKPPKPLTAITLGRTDDIMIGETAVAIGNPLGLENSITAGVISGKNRKLSSRDGRIIFDDLLQTDTPINPGNSGGALLNLSGELIGINVAVVQDSQSIGFAIPVEKVKVVLESYKNNKQLAIKHRGEPAPLPERDISQTAPFSTEEEWDPFLEMRYMRERMNEMFRDSVSKRQGARDKDKGMFQSDIFYVPGFDIEETGSGYLIRISVTDLDKSKIDIEINERSLTVSSQHSEAKEEAGPGTHFESRSFGSFSRTIPLPRDADIQKVKTKIEGDTLIITLPKRNE